MHTFVKILRLAEVTGVGSQACPFVVGLFAVLGLEISIVTLRPFACELLKRAQARAFSAKQNLALTLVPFAWFHKNS